MKRWIAIDVVGTPDGETNVYNVVIDHCSLSWAVDEVASTWYPGVSDVTFSNNIIAEGLWNSLHAEQPHSKGLLIGDHSRRIAAIGNLFAHNDDRNPSPAWTRIFVEDSGEFLSHWGTETLSDAPPLSFVPFEPLAAEEVEAHVLANAGATPWDRDEIDRRIVDEVTDRTGFGPDTVDEVGGFPDYDPTHRTLELPPAPNEDPDGDGWTNLDDWLAGHGAPSP